VALLKISWGELPCCPHGCGQSSIHGCQCGKLNRKIISYTLCVCYISI